MFNIFKKLCLRYFFLNRNRIEKKLAGTSMHCYIYIATRMVFVATSRLDKKGS